MTHLLRAVAILALLASCKGPPQDAYLHGTRSAESLDLGANAVHESCSLQRGETASDIYCGSYLEPSGRIVAIGQTAEDPAAFLTSSTWRTAFDSRFVCGGAAGSTVLNNPAATLSCTRRQGGWPHAVVAARIGNTMYVADGVKPAESVLPTAIGVMSGRLPSVKATAGVDNGLAAQHQAAEAMNANGAAAIAEVEAQTKLGSLENRHGNFVAAEVAYRTAVTLQERIVGIDNPALAVPLAREALQISNQGRFADADRVYARAERLAALPNQIDPNARFLVAYLRGLNLLNRKQPKEALVLLDRARTGFAAIVPPDLLAARSDKATAPRTAIEQMVQNTADAALIEDQTTRDALNGLIESTRYRAIALAQLGRSDEAQEALRRAQDLFLRGDSRIVARYYRTMGMTLATVEKHDEAATQLDEAVTAFTRAQPGTAPLAETELLSAAQHVRAGNDAAAVRECRSASQTLQSLQTGVSADLLTPCIHALALQASGTSQQSADIRTQMFALSQLAQGSITSQQIALAAARLAEGARDPKVAEAIRQYEAATNKLEALYRSRAELVAGKGDSAAVAQLDQEIAKAQDNLRDAGQARQEASPGYGALVQESVSSADVQRLLGPQEAVAVMILGADEGWTFLLRRDAISFGRIDGGAARIDALVKRIRASVEPGSDNRPPPYDTKAAHELYEAVLGPVADGLKDVTGLTVAPSGSLLSVPFGALLTAPVQDTAQLSAAPFLIRQVTVSHVPSAASFVNLRKSSRTSRTDRPAWFGMGDFRPASLKQALAAFPQDACGASAREFAGLPALPGAHKELDVARQMLNASAGDELLGPAFTVANIWALSDGRQGRHLADYRILHFAAHALLPSELRCQTEPAIVTSTPIDARDASAALLTSSQIEKMHLDADLVILSACNTGAGNGSGAGESLSGLARSFFFAGARALLVTHWEANDFTAPYLTALFLKALQDDPGIDPAAALAEAQRRMLDESAGAKAQQAHPYYWAVEALVGGSGSNAAVVNASVSPPERTGG